MGKLRFLYRKPLPFVRRESWQIWLRSCALKVPNGEGNKNPLTQLCGDMHFQSFFFVKTVDYVNSYDKNVSGCSISSFHWSWMWCCKFILFTLHVLVSFFLAVTAPFTKTIICSFLSFGDTFKLLTFHWKLQSLAVSINVCCEILTPVVVQSKKNFVVNPYCKQFLLPSLKQSNWNCGSVLTEQTMIAAVIMHSFTIERSYFSTILWYSAHSTKLLIELQFLIGNLSLLLCVHWNCNQFDYCICFLLCFCYNQKE